MMSEFSFVVFKLNIVSKRLSDLEVSDCSTDLTGKEILSLQEYRKYLIEMAILFMIDKPYSELTKSFFSDNKILFPDEKSRDENIEIFYQLSGQAVASLMRA